MVRLDPPGPAVRGRLALFIEGAIERTLEQLGAPTPGVGASGSLDASLSDQLYRARQTGMDGISLQFGTLAGIANLAGTLDAEDSAVVRWWLRAASCRPLRLSFDEADDFLGVYSEPEPLKALIEACSGRAELGRRNVEPAADDRVEVAAAREPDWPTDVAAEAAPESEERHEDYQQVVLPIAIDSSGLDVDSVEATDELDAGAPGSVEAAADELDLGPPASVDAAAGELVASAPGRVEAEAPEPEADELDAAAPGSVDAVAGELDVACVDAAASAPRSVEPQSVEPESVEPEAGELAWVDPLSETARSIAEGLDDSDAWLKETLLRLSTPPPAAVSSEDVALELQAEPEAAPASDPAWATSPEPAVALTPPSLDAFMVSDASEKDDTRRPDEARASGATEESFPNAATDGEAGAPADAFPTSGTEPGESLASRHPLSEKSAGPGDAPARFDIPARDEAPAPAPEASPAAENSEPSPEPSPAAAAAQPREPSATAATAQPSPEPSPPAGTIAPPSRAAENSEPSVTEPTEQRADRNTTRHVEAISPTSDAKAEDGNVEPASKVLAVDPEVFERCRAWQNELQSAEGPKPLAVVERQFTSAWVPLREAQIDGIAPAAAARALESWAASFEKSYAEAFNALRVRGKRPTMVLDAPDVALRLARLHGARCVQLLLVDSMRYDLGMRIHERLRQEVGSHAACAERLLFWSALPSTTATQLELIGRGPMGLRDFTGEVDEEMLVSRGSKASTIRRLKTGHREVLKLDLVEARLGEPGGPARERLDSIANETAERIALHLQGVPDRTLVLVFGDHGFVLEDREGGTTAAHQGGATPEEVLVPAFAWIAGAVH